MQRYRIDTNNRLVVPVLMDSSDETIVMAQWGVSAFIPNTIYKEGDLVSPTVDNGHYYGCIVAGKTREAPNWANGIVNSGTCAFKPVNYSPLVSFLETITASTWVVTNGVKIANQQFDDDNAWVMITEIPSGVKTFTLSNQITKNNGERFSYSFVYTIDPNSVIYTVVGSLDFTSPDSSGLIPTIG